MTTPETAPEAEVPGGQRNLFKSLVGVFFMYGSRGFGLLLTLALIGKLSIADYGLYALALTFSAILGPPIDFPWNVRAMRESDEEFARERASRFLLGAALMIAGAAFIPVSYFVWLGLVVAGGEIMFNVIKSQNTRDGHPDRVWRHDAIRQTTSVALTCGYLFGVHDPNLTVASLLYCTPYVVILVLAGFVAYGHRPAMPGTPRQMATLIGEMGIGTSLFLQGDVLLLGWLTSSTVVGYYNITLMVTTALAGVGQAFAMTYHEPLRRSGGDLSAGPKLRTTIGIATVAGVIVLITGIVMTFTPAPAPMSQAMIIMAGFCFLRTIICVFQVVLYAQRRDRLRFGASVILVPVKLGLLAFLVWLGLGAVAAATATTAADAILLAIFAVALYGKRKSVAPK